MGLWADRLRCGVSVNRGCGLADGTVSVRMLCREIGMSERIYRQLVAGESTNLRNYLRIIFWCIDQYPSGRRERLMCELANRLRQEFE